MLKLIADRADVTSPKPANTDPTFAKEAATLARINARIAAIDSEIDDLNTRAFLEAEKSSQSAGADALNQALKMLNSGKTASSAFDSDRARLGRERDLLARARGEQADRVEKIRGDLGYRAAAAAIPRHREALKEVLEAARRLADILEVEQSIRLELLDAGFSARPDVLPPPALNASLLLGRESDWNSSLAAFVRQLRDLGVEK